MSSLASLSVRHPSRVYLTLAPILALGALSPTPSLPPLVLLLALLRLHAFTLIPRRQQRSGILQVVLISCAVAIVHAGPSLHALSSQAISLIVLAVLAVVTTAIAGAAIAAGYYVERSAQAPWAYATTFPAIWATAWAAVEYCSPIGQLTTWSPVTQLGGYAWLRQIGGQVAINWVVAAWAVVISDAVGAWVVEADKENNFALEQPASLLAVGDDDLPAAGAIVHTPKRTSSSSQRSRTMLLLTGVLLALSVPSYFISDMPPHVSALDVTPFGVACALPYPQKNGVLLGPPSLDDYVAESKMLQSQAKIILWPEGAVHFNSRNEREKAFEAIRPKIANGTYYGIGFEEVVTTDSSDGIWKVGMRRNGIVLLGWEGIVYEYYKRNLVPIAESFSMTPSNEKPSVFTAQLPHPKSYTAPKWAPGPNFTRPLDITVSICLDFSTASSFADLPSRPALILAPARTWHTSVGLAMWEQAKARAEETGSMVLWCDGGEGGVSGVAGRGMHAFRQVGPGSWAQTVSMSWPFDSRRTLFSVGGTSTMLAIIWGVVAVSRTAGPALSFLEDRERAMGGTLGGLIRRVRSVVGSQQRSRSRGEEQPLLS